MSCETDGYEVYHLNGLNIERDFSRHQYYEILFVISGSLDLMSESGVYSAGSGTVALIPPGVYHCNMLRTSSAEYERYVLYFTREYLSALPELAALADSISDEVVYLPDEIQRRRLECDLDRLCQCRDKLRAFLLVSLIFNDVLSLERPIAVTERGSRGYIYKVISLISEHYRDKLTAADIAAKMGVSRTKLMTDFRHETGFTLADYIMRERVAHARRLLKDGFSVERAAEESGFTSDTHLRYCFRRVMDTTPSQYRKNGEKYEPI